MDMTASPTIKKDSLNKSSVLASELESYPDKSTGSSEVVSNGKQAHNGHLTGNAGATGSTEATSNGKQAHNGHQTNGADASSNAAAIKARVKARVAARAAAIAAASGNSVVPGSDPTAARATAIAAVSGNGVVPGSDTTERRRNPEDGKIYSFEEYKAAYEKDYLIEDLRKFWRDSMTLVQQDTPATCKNTTTNAPPVATDANKALAPKTTTPGGNVPPAVQAQQVNGTSAALPPSKGRIQQGSFGSIADWLNKLDESGNLLSYQATIVENCGSVEAILETYAPKGLLDKKFFEVCGVKKIGHKRIFERWFDNLHNEATALVEPPGPPQVPPLADEVDKICELLQNPAAKDQAEDLPISLVEGFYKSPGNKLCQVAASGDMKALAVFLALCGIIGIDWKEVTSDVGETVAEAAGNAGHKDLARALVRKGMRKPLSVVIAYSDVSVQEVEAMVKAGAKPDLYACAAAAQLEDDSKRQQLLAILGDPDKAAVWLQDALSGPSREWVAALRTARAYGVEMRV